MEGVVNAGPLPPSLWPPPPSLMQPMPARQLRPVGVQFDGIDQMVDSLSRSVEYEGRYVNGRYQDTHPTWPDYLSPDVLDATAHPALMAALESFRHWGNRPPYQVENTQPTDGATYLSLPVFELGCRRVVQGQNILWQSNNRQQPFYMRPENLDYYTALLLDDLAHRVTNRAVRLHNAWLARRAARELRAEPLH
jgi:hypothetical protein